MARLREGPLSLMSACVQERSSFLFSPGVNAEIWDHDVTEAAFPGSPLHRAVPFRKGLAYGPRFIAVRRRP